MPRAIRTASRSRRASASGTWHSTATSGQPLADATVVLDRLGILLAIHSGTGRRGEPRPGLLTSVNLFRYVFASLCDDPEILASRVPDDGFIKKDGVKRGLEADASARPSSRRSPTPTDRSRRAGEAEGA